MRPVYDSRVEDLSHFDRVMVECLGCGRKAELRRRDFERHHVKPYRRVLDLVSHMQCKACFVRGQVNISLSAFTSSRRR